MSLSNKQDLLTVPNASSLMNSKVNTSIELPSFPSAGVIRRLFEGIIWGVSLESMYSGMIHLTSFFSDDENSLKNDTKFVPKDTAIVVNSKKKVSTEPPSFTVADVIKGLFEGITWGVSLESMYSGIIDFFSEDPYSYEQLVDESLWENPPKFSKTKVKVADTNVYQTNHTFLSTRRSTTTSMF